MSTAFNRRSMEQLFYMTVQDITFASDAIGAAAGTGRSAAVATWSATDEVIFKGKLKHHLIFAIMAFAGQSVSITEVFKLVSANNWLDVENLTPTDIVDAVSIDPDDGEGIVVANDVTFLANITNNFRLSPSAEKNLIMSAKADAAKAMYRASVLEAICYLFKYDSVGNAPVYTLQNVALESVGGTIVGATYDDIGGTNGPTEYEAYLLKVANSVLGASVA